MAEIKNINSFLKRKQLREKLLKICEENDIVSMALFGSFIRGEQRKRSDLDILIKFAEGKEKGLLKFVGIKFKLERIFRKKVDLATIGALSPYIKDNVLSNIKVIYEKQ